MIEKRKNNNYNKNNKELVPFSLPNNLYLPKNNINNKGDV